MAHADAEYERAEAHLAQAYNQYFAGMLSGKYSTPEKKSELASKTITPAQTQMNRLLNQRWETAISNALKPHSRPYYSLDSEAMKTARTVFAKDAAGVDGPGPTSLAGNSASSGSGAAKASGAPGESVAAEAAPGPTIDGRGIPKLLDFKKKK